MHVEPDNSEKRWSSFSIRHHFSYNCQYSKSPQQNQYSIWIFSEDYAFVCVLHTTSYILAKLVGTTSIVGGFEYSHSLVSEYACYYMQNHFTSKAAMRLRIDLSPPLSFLNICMKKWNKRWVSVFVFHCFIFTQRPAIPVHKLFHVSTKLRRYTQSLLTLVGMQPQYYGQEDQCFPFTWMAFCYALSWCTFSSSAGDGSSRHHEYFCGSYVVCNCVRKDYSTSILSSDIYCTFKTFIAVIIHFLQCKSICS